MLISTIISKLERFAPPVLQESYDNAGLITGNPNKECEGILCCLDCLEPIIDEAIEKKCNLIVAHHPIIFKGLKKITGSHYVEDVIIKAIKNDIAIYAMHTNLDNVLAGVNGAIAEKLGLLECSALMPKKNTLTQISVIVPKTHFDVVRESVFNAGGGSIGKYSECSFAYPGMGSFKAGSEANPFVGKNEERHYEEEMKIEFLAPSFLAKQILKAIQVVHPYEEVAYFETLVENEDQSLGSGLIGNLKEEVDVNHFFALLKSSFNLQSIRHTKLCKQTIKRVAVCGGAGSGFILNAMRLKADVYITADVKYHEFFEADEKIIIADIGHYESEQFTINLMADFLGKIFTTFAVLKTDKNTNPVFYYN